MPKRNKLPKVDMMVVQKSNPLQALCETDMTLSEFKILDVYLSRIDSHKPENRVVTFSKGEIEKLLGVQRIRKEQLSERLKHLMSNVVEVADKDETKGFKLITLFEEADAEQDQNGVWQVRLECTKKAMKYIFNIENLGYLRYRLKNIIDLTSRYSYVMYLFLEHNRYRNPFTVSISELKKVLNCTEETYKEYKHFNNLVLKKCHKEICEKTDTEYTYTPIRDGRKIVAIQFELSEKKSSNNDLVNNLVNDNLVNDDLVNNNLVDNDLQIPTKVAEREEPQAKEPPIKEPKMIEPPQEPVRVTFEEPVKVISEEPQELEYQNDTLEFLAEACNREFNNIEMMVIFEILATKKLEETGMGIEFDRYHYLAKRYSELKYYATKMKIYNRFAYFKKMLEY